MTAQPPADAGPPIADTAVFMRRLRVATYGIVLLVLMIYLLEKFRDILQPLFVAMFIGFLMHPIHRWLVRRGIPSLPAYGVILVLITLGIFGIGTVIYANFTQVSSELPKYKARLSQAEAAAREQVNRLPFKIPGLQGLLENESISPEQLVFAARAALGRFGDFTSWAALTFVFLLFLIAEKVGFPDRLCLAFGPEQGQHLLGIVDSIGLAIGEYIAVKTLVSALAGFLSYAVLAFFDLHFAATWGILIFLLNYIPYLGSLIAVALPIGLSFLQFDEAWKGIVIAVLLIGIQQAIGTFLEPRMAGQRLDVSPLLIVLSLAFWYVVWGVPGAILAVPLLVIVRIILDNIRETRPLATLISNQ